MWRRGDGTDRTSRVTLGRLALAVALASLAALGTSSVAGASSGAGLVTLVPNPGTQPLVSGQYFEIEVGANPILQRGHDLVIEECSAPTRPGWDWPIRCDRHTVQPTRVRAGHHGTVQYSDFPVYALPDPLDLGETSHHRPVCDLTHACVIMVGWDIDDPGHEVWSQAFFVGPGGGPGNGLPETPYVLALPVLAVGIFGGWVVLRRRRAAGASRP